MSTPDDAYEWLPVREAADRLNASASTILRMIREGSLVAELGSRSERDKRPQYLVRFDRPQETPVNTPEATMPHQEASDATMPAALTTRMLDTLDALLLANGATIERQAETIARLSASEAMWRERTQEAGARADRAERERAAAEAERDRLRAELEAERARPWWRFW